MAMNVKVICIKAGVNTSNRNPVYKDKIYCIESDPSTCYNETGTHMWIHDGDSVIGLYNSRDFILLSEYRANRIREILNV